MNSSTFNIAPPALATFALPPSWCNNHGHVDRAACIELGVAEARQIAGCVPHKAATRYLPITRRMELRAAARRDGGMPAWKYRRLKEASVLPLPGERRAVNGRGRIASGVIVISARQLHLLHEYRTPRRLAGDFRTSRANAMRDQFASHSKYAKHTYRCRVDRRDLIAYPAAQNLDGNPNKGATRTKMIGVDRLWSQALRVEIWKYPKRIRPAYYFVCPGKCPAQLATTGMNATVPAARLSSCKAGRKDPKSRECPQRCLKLLMVQCTKDEWRDAMVAQRWIECLPQAVVPRARAAIDRLLVRYGSIFQPRMLLCPRCLGAKYGNHPETVRQGWRRRNGKPDASTKHWLERRMQSATRAKPSAPQRRKGRCSGQNQRAGNAGRFGN